MNPNNGPLKFLWRRGGGLVGIIIAVVIAVGVLVVSELVR
jgi:hypothetical protein